MRGLRICLSIFVVFVLMLCGVNSRAQELPAKKHRTVKKSLDERSVLMEWRKDSGSDSISEKSESDVSTTQAISDAEIDERITEAQRRASEGLTDQAVIIYKQILAHDPKNKRARFGVGTAYIQAGRFRDALDVMEPMIDEYPKDYFLKNNIAWLYATARDPTIRNGKRAVALAQDALLVSPEDYHVWSTLSEAYYVSGEYEKAQRAAEQALQIGRNAGLNDQFLEEYRYQIDKTRKAVKAMSVID